MPIRLFVLFTILFVSQIFLFNALTLYDLAYAFIFPIIFWLFPLHWNYKWNTLIAFILGLIVDVSLLKIGIHAFTSVLMMTLREVWIDLITPQINPNERENFKPYTQSTLWAITYFVPLTFMYSLVYHVMRDLGFSLNTFWKFLLTGIYSAFWIILLYSLFVRQNEKR